MLNFRGVIPKPEPIPSMYGIFTYIYHTNQPNVGKIYAIHGWFGECFGHFPGVGFSDSRIHHLLEVEEMVKTH